MKVEIPGINEYFSDKTLFSGDIPKVKAEKDFLDENFDYIKSENVKVSYIPSAKRALFYNQISRPLQSTVNYALYYLKNYVNPTDDADNLQTDCKIRFDNVEAALGIIIKVKGEYQKILDMMKAIYKPD